MIKAPRLHPGDTVATISLSWGGPATFPDRYEVGKRQLAETFSLNVIESRYALADDEWLYRNPQARADDLMECFANPDIKAIFSTIGGEESIRILPYLDLDIIARNPKIFTGFSDTTISLLACYKAGLVSFYGPSIMAGYAENGGIFPYMVDSVQRAFFSADPIGAIAPNPDGWTIEFLDWGDPTLQSQPRILQPNTGWRWIQGHGTVEGHLLGGCIDVMDWLRGTAYWPTVEQWDGAILFLETSEENPPPDYVHRTLRAWNATGALANVAALLFGRPRKATLAEQVEYDSAILTALAECGLGSIPVVTGMDFGHTEPQGILPIGVRARLNCTTQKLVILESAVND